MCRYPDHLAGLRTRMRDSYATELATVQAELERRFGRTAPDCLGTFNGAADLALLEQLCRDDLIISDRWKLRRFWEALTAAR